MLPGIILPRNEVPSLSVVEKGQLCSVNIVENRYITCSLFLRCYIIIKYSFYDDHPRASLGVGVALMSHDAMVANQWRGKGLRMLHLFSDRLW